MSEKFESTCPLCGYRMEVYRGDRSEDRIVCCPSCEEVFDCVREQRVFRGTGDDEYVFSSEDLFDEEY